MRRATIESAATGESVDRATLGDVVEVVDPETGATALEVRNATTAVHATSASNPKRAGRQATARFRRAERSSVKMSMRVVGDPTLHAKSIVELRGVSSLLTGKYYVTDVKHLISSSGYVCQLKMVRDGTGRRARRLARQQRGQKNKNKPRKSSELTQVEVVDPETGRTIIEFYRDGKRIGAEDPELGMSLLME